jgi:diacylglycerol kinase (ATP)
MKCIYVYNPTSGKQNNPKKRDYILRELGKKFDVVDCKSTKKRGDAGAFAREACGQYDVLVVSGGDGTLNEVINAIATEKVRPKIGYIPTGTTNDLAHSLKISRNVKKAVKIILDGKSAKHDIFKVNDRYGIYVCCFGIFTKSSYATSQKEKKYFGRFAYFRYGVKEIFTSNSFPAKITYDGGEQNGNYALGIIANSRYVAGFRINKMASCDDGCVNLVLVKDYRKKGVSLPTLTNIFKLFLFGLTTLKNGKKYTILKLNKFHIDVPEKTIINLDGESGLKGPFDLEVLKQHVEIFVK